MADIQLPATPALMSVEDFARWHGISTSTVRECMAGTSKTFPPLRSKRSRGKRRLVFITAEAAAEWRANFPDA